MGVKRYKKEEDQTNQTNQDLNSSAIPERIPEFDVNGTALNELHSLFEN
nr:hypothetical protein [Neobacillus sp. Marseille-Q6967]